MRKHPIWSLESLRKHAWMSLANWPVAAWKQFAVTPISIRFDHFQQSSSLTKLIFVTSCNIFTHFYAFFGTCIPQFHMRQFNSPPRSLFMVGSPEMVPIQSLPSWSSKGLDAWWPGPVLNFAPKWLNILEPKNENLVETSAKSAKS